MSHQAIIPTTYEGAILAQTQHVRELEEDVKTDPDSKHEHAVQSIEDPTVRTYAGNVGTEDNTPAVQKKELWAYYLYYNGDNGTAANGFCSTQFQNLMTQASFDPAVGPSGAGSCTGNSGQCVLPFGSGTKTVTSYVLLANGLSFCIMTLGFTTFGAVMDYGNASRWILMGLTIICWAFSLGFLGLVDASQWKIAMACYMIAYITYGATLVFYAALFPRITRNLPEARNLRAKLDNGEISTEEYELEENLLRNMVSDLSTAHSNWGYLITLCLNLTILLPLPGGNRTNNYVIALCTGYWIICALPWFVFQQKRPGPPLPKGTNVVTVGWTQIYKAVKSLKRLPQTFLFLIGFFFLADGLNTTGTLVGIVQNDNISFSFLESTYLGLCQASTSVLSCYGFWYAQKYFKINTKKAFLVTNVATVMIPLWGMIGLWTDKIGFHNRWEFYFYNVFFGLFQAPYYALSQTMMADLCPPGYEGTFFSLFGLTNRASSIIGPNVVQALVNGTNNNWDGFAFTFALCFTASCCLYFVDIVKGHRDAVVWAEERRELDAREGAAEIRELKQM